MQAGNSQGVSTSDWHRPAPALARLSGVNLFGGNARETGQEWAFKIEELPSAAGVEAMDVIPRLR